MTTTLNCLSWMQNQDGQNPCTTAQEVGQLCNSGYTVTVTNFIERNYIPDATATNGCTCSWSIYNLLSACSFCVGQPEYTSWSTWIANCGSYASDNSYLPSGLSLSQGIPFWAATNPSTWENAVFNLTQAANTAEQAEPDVTGGPLPTSTTVVASASHASVGTIAGGAIGGIVIIIVGGSLIICIWCRCRRQRQRAASSGISSSDASQSAVASVTWNHDYARTPPSPISTYLGSPILSVTNPAQTFFGPHVSPDFSSGARNAAPPPIADAANMIAPFLATSSRNQPNALPSTRKAAEALSERAAAAPGRRVRLNPPPYSASAAPESSEMTNWSPGLSRKKNRKRERKNTGTTTRSGMTMRDSVVVAPHTDSQMEQSLSRTTAPDTRTTINVERAVSTGSMGDSDDGGIVGTTHGRTAGASDGSSPEA